ncbi:MAG: sporulation transcription factor Spo0A [Eubacteriales bacterium]|nr:sporulation transcription factor Spo0A [Eubacteriales bacterium]
MDEERIKVVIAEENVLLRSAVESYLYKEKRIEIVGMAPNGETAVELIEKKRPDVLVTDIILPKLDGIAVMERMHALAPQCRAIVLTALTQENFVMRAMEAGADYFMAKPFDMEVLRARILECGAPRSGAVNPFSASLGGMTKSRDEKISTIFITIGIPAHIKGYQFLREAIKMVADNPDLINRITKELYPGIAKRFDTTPSKVERAIRHAIEVAWTRGKIDNINQIFGFNVYGRNEKPTNGEFIALVADKLVLEKSA